MWCSRSRVHIHYTSVEIIISGSVEAHCVCDFLTVIVDTAIWTKCSKFKRASFDSKCCFALLHPRRITHNFHSNFSKVSHTVQETGSTVSGFIYIVGLPLSTLFAGGHGCLFELISAGWWSTGQSRAVSTQGCVIGLIVFLFVTENLRVQSSEPIIIGLVRAAILAVIKIDTGHLIYGILTDCVSYAVGMISALFVVAQLFSTDIDLEPSSDPAWSCFGIVGLFALIVKVDLLLISDVGTASHDLINQLYNLCSCLHLPGLTVGSNWISVWIGLVSSSFNIFAGSVFIGCVSGLGNFCRGQWCRSKLKHILVGHIARMPFF